MKKTVLALSFALCASFAFAQTKNVTSVNRADRSLRAMQTISMDELQQEVGFNASIFTKDEDPVPFQTWDFANTTEYVTGIVTSTSGDSTAFIMPDGTSVKFLNHQNTEEAGKWLQLDSTNDPRLDNPAVYPYWSQMNQAWMQANGFTMLQFRFDSARTETTGKNGLMFMSLLDLPDGDMNPVNAYVELGTVSTMGKAVVDISLFQLYHKFYDECYVDYSFDDGATWHTVGINVDGVDVNINEMIWGTSTYTLPLEVANHESVKFRIRRYALPWSNVLGTYWAFDDVKLFAGEADRWERWKPQYVEGAYQMMPKGLDLPLLWYARVRNNGVNEKTDIVTTVYDYDIATQESTTIITSDQANVPSDPQAIVPFFMDPAGWNVNVDGEVITFPLGIGFYEGSLRTPGVTGKGLNTSEAGKKMVYSTITSNSGEQSYDTITYRVTCEEGEDGIRTWGYDNGILGRDQFFGYGATDDGFMSDTGHFAKAGYTVLNRYTTGAVVPEGWVLRGVEMVVTTETGKADAYSKILPVVYKDAYPGDGAVQFKTVNLGIGEYEVQAADFEENNQIVHGSGTEAYLTPEDNYKTIRIIFPEQPELEPYTSYRVGYQLAEDGQFAVAANSNRFYIDAHDGYDSVIFYREREALKPFSKFFGTDFGYGVAQPYSTLVYDPLTPRGSRWHFAPGGISGAPMIRALVGPRDESIAQKNITIECEGNEDAGVSLGTVIYDLETLEDLCGSVKSVAEGGTYTFYVEPSEGYHVAEILIDGEALDINNDEQSTDVYEAIHFGGTAPDGTTYDYWAVTFTNVAADHTLKAKYAEGAIEGIDPVNPSVRIKLQPNPATSQVRLSLSGVEGMVNCSLIDMSGRVVYNQSMNAEDAKIIDLSNVAKGAYFVRITNNQFSKIEKLIVR